MASRSPYMYSTLSRLGLSHIARETFEWIIIQGIANCCDGTKSDSWKRFASLMAASLTAHFISHRFLFKGWSHYGR